MNKNLWNVLFLAALPLALFAEPVFEHRIILEGISRADDLSAVDINGDGRLDLVCSADGIRWFRNPGSTDDAWVASAPLATYPEGFEGDRGHMGLGYGDFDGDGDFDLCAGSKGDFPGHHRPLLWWENLAGDGSVWAQHLLTTNFTGHIDHSRSHDFNGDGRDDLVMERYGAKGEVFLLLSPADPRGLWSAHRLTDGTAGLELADVTGDGKTDVVTGGLVLTAPGIPDTETWPSFRFSHGDWDKFAVGDVNGDGRADIAVSEGEGCRIGLFFAPAWDYFEVFSGGKGLHSLALRDFDDDGDLDILTADIHGGGAHVFLNTGAGKEWKEYSFPAYKADGSHNMVAADFDQDGRVDFAGKHYTANSAVEIWYNRTEAPPQNGLRMRLQSDSGVVRDESGRVVRWEGMCPRGTVAWQEEAAHRPLYVENILNGRPVLRFDAAAEQYLDFTAFDPDGLSEMTLVVVSANTAPIEHRYGTEGGVHGTCASTLQWHETGSWGTTYLSPFSGSVSYRFGSGQPDNVRIFTRPEPIGSAFSVSVAIKQGPLERVFVGNREAARFTVERSQLANNSTYGLIGKGRGNTFFSGDIACLMVYDRALTDAELQTLAAYFAAQYGL